MQWLLLPLAALGLAAETRASAAVAVRSTLRAGKALQLATAQQFLLISSPGERKICWTRLHVPGQPQPVETSGGPGNTLNIFPLIDAGLVNPRGIALDRKRGRLYVADPDGKAIFSYRVLLNKHGEPDSDKRRLTVVANVEPMWVTVDEAGSLYYSEKLSNTVMRVNLHTLKQLEAEEIQATQLRTLSEAQEDAEQKLRENQAVLDAGGPTPPPAEPLVIDTLYSGAAGITSVSAPGGLAVDGTFVLWANEAAGTTHGSVVEGGIGSVRGPDTVKVLADNVNNVFGLASSDNALFFTTNTQYVYGMKRNGGEVVAMTDSLQSPRGIVWDGDGTMYVADQAGSMVYSFPSGRLKATHTSRVTQLHDAFGLAIFASDDPFVAADPASAASSIVVGLLMASW